MAKCRYMGNGIYIIQKDDLEKVKEKDGKLARVYCDIMDGKIYCVLEDSLSEVEKVKIDLKKDR